MTKTRDLANLIADSKIGPTEIDTSGTYTVGGIVTSGNVDGRDVSVDGAKLDGIEASADVTDTTNVTAAGALMDSEVTNLAAVKALNQGLATTDEPSFNNTILNAIAKDISDTALDVFVYDTSKDSDGGAWRHKTKHTSWYNETLDTSTRGSRKEFPSVAVIVAKSGQVTIYDGDDPDMPMWMIFSQPTGSTVNFMATNAKPVSAIRMLNGNLCIGFSDGGWAISQISFISDSQRWLWSSSIYYQLTNSVSERNVEATQGYIQLESFGLLGGLIKDIAMKVLPNTLTNYATELPVPVLLVTTNLGASIVRDNPDGSISIFDKGTSAATMDQAEWLGSNLVVSAPSYYGIYKDPFKEESSAYLSNTSDANYYWADNDNGTQAFNFPRPLGNTDKLVTIEPRTIATSNTVSTVNNFYGQAGLTIHELSESDITDNTNGMNAYIASDYNTGWQIGNNKLSTLSDTDTTDAVGGNLVTNGTFASDSSWTKGGNWAIGSGVASINTTNNDLLSQDISMVSGKTYTASITITAYTDGELDVRFGGTATQTATGTGVHTFTGVAGGSTLQIYAFTNATFSIDNVSVHLAEKDRSVHGNGLQVYGTVSKSAVETGAELVKYTGFSSSNYLKQCYNPDLNFGTGDFTYAFWCKSPSSGNDRIWLCHGRYYTANSGLNVLQYNSGGSGDEAQFYVGAPASGIVTVTGVEGLDWQHWVATRRSGTLYVYRNGKFEGSGQQPQSVNLSNETDQDLILGVGKTSSGIYGNGAEALALLRISATCMSPAQIKKMYEDEKRLFNPNAKATLYGSSDTVTGLAYDDITKELHVGTSAGRSTFQGLSRTANTTDAVGTVISASNGLVAEE